MRAGRKVTIPPSRSLLLEAKTLSQGENRRLLVTPLAVLHSSELVRPVYSERSETVYFADMSAPPLKFSLARWYYVVH